MRAHAAKWFCLALLAPSVSGCIFGEGSVTRVYAGRSVEGPYITPEAYAHYAQGVIEESQGNFAKAQAEYQRVLLDDDSSADVWTRLGAVLCATRQEATSAFAKAEELDPKFAPMWRERARCTLAGGNAAAALAQAERAVALDPDDELASLTVASALAKLGRNDEAQRWVLALSLRGPPSPAVKEALGRSVAPSPAAPSPPPRSDALGAHFSNERRPTLADVDRALAERAPARARRLAKLVGLRTSHLALRAAALGVTDVARTEAARVLDADPNDSDALIAALSAASLDGDPAGVAALLTRGGAEPLAPSSLGVRLFAELLRRRVGKDAAAIWLEGWALTKAREPLEARVEARGAQ
ncbi:MAG: tetratricopeptide repeat protein [Myxococcales bacterium]|nr:tetratricopeptide repeat protein [Myxococcales bacterium]